MPNNDTLMTVAEVAEYLRVDSNTVYLYTRKGKLGSYKAGGIVRISREQLRAFMETKK